MFRNVKKHEKKSFSIRKKLILSYVLLVFISLVLYFFSYYWNSSRYLKNEKMLLYTNSAASICQNIETQLHSYSVFAMVVSSNKRLQDYFNKPPEDILEQLNIVSESIVPLLESFQILNPTVLNLTLYTSTPGNKIQSDYIQFVSPEQFKIDNLYHAEYPWQFSNNTLVQHTSIFCINAYPQKPVGYLEVILDAPEIFRSSLSGSETEFQIHIFANDNQLIWSNYESADSFHHGNKAIQIARIPLENTSLTIDFSIPADQFYAGISDSAISNTLPLLAVCFATFGVLIFLYTRAFTKSIRTLTEIVKKIDQNNLNINIDMKQNDEVSILADCLNGMLRKINLLISDIYRAKEAEKQAELDALRTQINPHFLYNTMDVINWMAISENTKSICNITGLISQYYRTMLNHGEFYTTLAAELSNIKSYISIQLIMHANSFDVQYDCDDSLLQNKVPNFILQPAVENAIKHGIDPLSERRGLLRIVIHESEGCIFVDICDNSMGLTAEQLQSLNETLVSDSRHTGYGLCNVQKRIQMAFGTGYGLTLFSKPGEGFVTRFRLPFSEG